MVRSQAVSEEKTIAALAKAAGVGVETVRYYQRRGLMPVPKARSSSFRTYDDAHVERLIFIRRAQSAGFTLEEIRELLKLDRGNDRAPVRERLIALEAKMDELREAHAALSRLVGACHARKSGPCPIIEAFAPAEDAK